MRKYEFALRFATPSDYTVSDDLVEELGEAGCDDALIGVGRAGRIGLEFVRASSSAHDAIMTAIGQVRRVLPDAKLIEVAPDLVGVTDVAALVGCSRQNMRKLLVMGSGAKPAPVHEGTVALWHLASVLKWIAVYERYSIPTGLLELSETTMRVNAALDTLRIDDAIRDEIRVLLA